MIFCFSNCEKVRNKRKQTGNNRSGNSLEIAANVRSLSIDQVKESNIKRYKAIGKIKYLSKLTFSFLKLKSVTIISKANEILLNAYPNGIHNNVSKTNNNKGWLLYSCFRF